MCLGQEFAAKRPCHRPFNPVTEPPDQPSHEHPACVGQSIFLHKVYANIFTRNPHKLRRPARCPNKPYLADVWGSVSGPAAPAHGSTGSGSAAYFACHLRLSTLRPRFWRIWRALREWFGPNLHCLPPFGGRQINLLYL